MSSYRGFVRSPGLRLGIVLSIALFYGLPAEAHRPRDNASWLLTDVILQPNTEHWPGSYVPESYRLEGYRRGPRNADAPDGPERHICHTAHARHLSTRDIACPSTAGNASPSRTLRTSGPARSPGVTDPAR